MLQERIGIYVYFRQNKFIRQLKRFGHLIYVNKSQRYLLLYINRAELEHTMTSLKQLKYVSDIVLSEYANIARTYDKETNESKDYRVI